MRKSIWVLAIVFVLSIVSGCECTHQWVEQGCGKESVCYNCDETNGEILEHDYVGRTCIKAGKCARCGEVGLPEGHSWTDESFEFRNYCTACRIFAELPEVTEEMCTGLPNLRPEMPDELEGEIDLLMASLQQLHSQYLSNSDVECFVKLSRTILEDYDYLPHVAVLFIEGESDNSEISVIDDYLWASKELSLTLASGTVGTAWIDAALNRTEENMLQVETALIEEINAYAQFYYGCNIIAAYKNK